MSNEPKPTDQCANCWRTFEEHTHGPDGEAWCFTGGEFTMSNEQEETMPILGIRVPGLTCVPMRLLSSDMAENNHSQSLKRLKERGGLAVGEILAIMHGKGWSTYKNDIDSANKVLEIVNADVRREVEELKAENEKANEALYVSNDLIGKLQSRLAESEALNGERYTDDELSDAFQAGMALCAAYEFGTYAIDYKTFKSRLDSERAEKLNTEKK